MYHENSSIFPFHGFEDRCRIKIFPLYFSPHWHLYYDVELDMLVKKTAISTSENTENGFICWYELALSLGRSLTYYSQSGSCNVLSFKVKFQPVKRWRK